MATTTSQALSAARVAGPTARTDSPQPRQHRSSAGGREAKARRAVIAQAWVIRRPGSPVGSGRPGATHASAAPVANKARLAESLSQRGPDHCQRGGNLHPRGLRKARRSDGDPHPCTVSAIASKRRRMMRRCCRPCAGVLSPWCCYGAAAGGAGPLSVIAEGRYQLALANES